MSQLPAPSVRGQARERAALLWCSKCVPRRDQRRAAWRRCSRRRTRPWMDSASAGAAGQRSRISNVFVRDRSS
jgi:hypothetical protein